ncbi:rod shape-determining protein MreC [Idiomarina sp. WRN-38]|uniref:rod shape-determining protein MreC n=1 Tax=Idiomarina sp. OXR-189 TaxID=3100175 RepID=UPI0007337A51|nr:rod shape-determining protein MreC [Idiomarina sp. OXR-189]KTG28499.1 rod shape-determining protein MreC [Idiomarina sp. H105]MCH2455436.1 rod shape-determining protein MreC [Idiomarina sp.]OAF08027.1 rod shape-determining protein MreC [Idiomarina sp. WRN-38]WPZ01703.1 rod shape-determining protein MreC [Idiomarina sp. OXR-189]
MKTLFVRGPSLLSRLVLALACSFLLIFIDHRLQAMQPVRVFLNSLVAPVQYLAILPEQLLDNFSESVKTTDQLSAENKALKQRILKLQGQQQQLQFLQNENRRLRELLGSDARESARRMVAEVIAVASEPFSQQLVINKGTLSGVYEGQPVLDSSGIIGQVQDVGGNTARVLLISDQSHAISLRSERNDIRALAQGTGDIGRLELMFIPHSTELREGDLLMSSGLGGVFPEGYPVARIASIVRDESLPFATVFADPVSALDRVRNVLLLWPSESELQPIYEDDE